MPPVLRTALLGYGYAGKTFHAPLIDATPGLALHCIGSSAADKVHADWPAVTVVDSMLQAAQQPDIDLVVIATPNDTHAALADAALRAGKHVVVDKPFTLTLDEAKALGELAQRHGRLLSVFHNRRWDSDFLTLQQLLQAGTLGDIVSFESRFDRFRPEVRQRWREQAGLGGGLWYDLGPHLVDQALQLFGRPWALSAAFTRQREHAEIVDWFHVRLDYGRLQVQLSASMLVAGGCPRFSVHGTRGSWIKYGLDPQEERLKQGGRPGGAGWGQDLLPGSLYPGDGGETMAVAGLPGDYRCYYAAIAGAIAGYQPNPVPASQAIAVMEIIELAQLSASKGSVIKLPLPEQQA